MSHVASGSKSCAGKSMPTRVVTKHGNRLSPSTIRDLMQYKRWVTRHRIKFEDIADKEQLEISDGEADVEIEAEEEEDEMEVTKSLNEWLKN